LNFLRTLDICECLCMYIQREPGTGWTEDERRPNNANSCGRVSFSKDERDGPSPRHIVSGTLLPRGCPLRNSKKSVTIGVFKIFHVLRTRESFLPFYESRVHGKARKIDILHLYNSNFSKSLPTMILPAKKYVGLPSNVSQIQNF